MKIAILSLVYNNWNHGGMLQGYALYKYLNISGYDANQIVFPFWKTSNNGLRSILEDFVSRSYFTNEIYERIMLQKHSDPRNLNNLRKFQKNFLNRNLYFNWDSIYKANRLFDCFIVGSDQVWNYKYFSNKVLNVFGLLFVNKEKKKVSYAASVGNAKGITDRKDFFQNMLSHLDNISVRERSIQTELSDIAGRNIEVTMDPTFLLDKEQWEDEMVEPATENRYVFSYFLNEKGNRHNKENITIAELANLPIYCISDELDMYTRVNDKQILDAGPREFIGYIHNAEYVITNSFHAVVFSLIFRKSFFVFGRYSSSGEVTANDRIFCLLQEIGLEDRFLDGTKIINTELLNKPIDYIEVWKILDEKAAESKQWLTKVLG